MKHECEGKTKICKQRITACSDSLVVERPNKDIVVCLSKGDCPVAYGVTLAIYSGLASVHKIKAREERRRIDW